jgi:hypothetical protein
MGPFAGEGTSESCHGHWMYIRVHLKSFAGSAAPDSLSQARMQCEPRSSRQPPGRRAVKLKSVPVGAPGPTQHHGGSGHSESDRDGHCDPGCSTPSRRDRDGHRRRRRPAPGLREATPSWTCRAAARPAGGAAVTGDHSSCGQRPAARPPRVGPARPRRSHEVASLPPVNTAARRRPRAFTPAAP